MKTYVVTDSHGKVIGSARVEESKSPGVPFGAIPVAAMPGQKVHEVDLPKELHGVKSADELHQHLAKLIKGGK